MVPVVGLLVLAVVVVILLLRFMRTRRMADPPVAPSSRPAPLPVTPSPSKEEQDYLDSSHILPPGQNPLDTRAIDWRNDKRK